MFTRAHMWVPEYCGTGVEVRWQHWLSVLAFQLVGGQLFLLFIAVHTRLAGP